MENQTDPLSRLIDIQLPTDPSVWPPAPGWWLIALVAAIALIYAFRQLIRWNQYHQPLREFVHKVNSVDNSLGPDSRPVANLSRVLRQYTIHRYGREQVAKLSGAAWLEFLDSKTVSGDGFSRGVGATLGDDLYRNDSQPDVNDLKQFLTAWARGKV